MGLKRKKGIGIIIISLLIFSSCSWRSETTAETVSNLPNNGKDYVILLHGLWNRSSRLADFESHFKAQGYQVLNLDYPSTKMSIKELEKLYLRPIISAIPLQNNQKVHFITHSMGGILLRQYFRENKWAPAGRIVMISPPNQGSHWADLLTEHTFYRFVAGPAAYELRTTNNDFLQELGAADFYLGIIGGDKSYFSGSDNMLPGADDGIVAVESMKIEGMKDMIIIHDDHRGLTENPQAIHQAEYFIKNGMFNRNSL